MPTKSSQRSVAVCAGAAGLLTAISSLAPWVRVGQKAGSHFFVSWIITGWRYTGYLSQGAIGSTPTDPHRPGGVGAGAGDVTLICGGLVAGLAVGAMRGQGWRRSRAVMAMSAGLLGIVVPVLVLLSVRHGNGQSHGGLVEHVSYGLWLTLGASAVAAVASLSAIRAGSS